MWAETQGHVQLFENPWRRGHISKVHPFCQPQRMKLCRKKLIFGTEFGKARKILWKEQRKLRKNRIINLAFLLFWGVGEQFMFFSCHNYVNFCMVIILWLKLVPISAVLITGINCCSFSAVKNTQVVTSFDNNLATKLHWSTTFDNLLKVETRVILSRIWSTDHTLAKITDFKSLPAVGDLGQLKTSIKEKNNIASRSTDCHNDQMLLSWCPLGCPKFQKNIEKM